MTDITLLTQQFYQRCMAVENAAGSSELVKANDVGWESIAVQNDGFKTASDLPWIDWKKAKSVLDVGCGYGDLLRFLSSNKLYTGEYHGIDIMPNFIINAILNCVGRYNSHFQTGNFLEQDWHDKKFEIVISLGGIGVNYDYPEPNGKKSLEYAQKFIAKLVEVSSSAVSLYFPNIDNKRKEAHNLLAYHKISEIESMISQAGEDRLRNITFVSYPTPKDSKTIAKIELSK